MANGIYGALSMATAHDRQIDVIANNIANADTDGYKQLRATFSSHLVASQDAMATKGFTALASTETDLRPGAIKNTGNPLDLAIAGPGYLMVRTPSGDRLTRAGSLRTNAQGILTDVSGHPVMSGGAGAKATEIRIPPESGQLSVASNGEIAADGTVIARITVMDAPDQNMRHLGDGMFEVPPDARPLENAELMSGHLEASNVNAIRGMVDLIETTRSFETAQRMMSRYREIDTKTMSSI